MTSIPRRRPWPNYQLGYEPENTPELSDDPYRIVCDMMRQRQVEAMAFPFEDVECEDGLEAPYCGARSPEEPMRMRTESDCASPVIIKYSLYPERKIAL